MKVLVVNKKTDKALFQEAASVILPIEAQGYPEYMQGLQSEEPCIQDLLEYCDSSKVTLAYTQNTYIIVTKREVVDLCTQGKLTITDLLGIKDFLHSHFGTGKKFSLDARETTSYKLISHMARRNQVIVHEDDSWYWGNECFHSMTLSFL